MAGNSFGNLFRITTAGESHGLANVVIIDGVPPGIALSEEDLQADLNRRKPGQSKITTQRKESDLAKILSGVFEGKTTGTSLAIMIENEDQRSKDYSNIKDKYRPGHADFTFDQKFGFRDYRGGGRSSARETVARVAAGAVAKKILSEKNIEIIAYVKQVGDIIANSIDINTLKLTDVEKSIVRCPDDTISKKMIDKIDVIRKEQNSIGGIAEIIIRNVPAGIGEPVFDKLRADLAKAFFSLPAVQGVEFGAGFSVATMKGTENNDYFISENDKVLTKTNNHGGMLGGISSGMPIIARCAIKPTSSLSLEQDTIDNQLNKTTIQTKGRHDPCLLPRFIPMAEAMAAIVILDHMMLSKKI